MFMLVAFAIGFLSTENISYIKCGFGDIPDVELTKAMSQAVSEWHWDYWMIYVISIYGVLVSIVLLFCLYAYYKAN